MFVVHSYCSQNINSLAFSPDGRLLAVGGDRTGLEIWDVANRSHLRGDWKEASYISNIQRILFTREGQYLYVTATRSGARVVDASDGRHRCFTPDPEGLAKTMSLAPGNLLLVCEGGYGQRESFLSAWDVEQSHDPKSVWRTPSSGEFCECEFPSVAPDGLSFAIVERGPGKPPGGVIAVRSLRTGELIREFPTPGRPEYYKGMAFASDGSHLLLVSASNIYRLDAITGKLTSTVGKPGRGSFADVAIHLGSELMLTAHLSTRSVNVWDIVNLSVRTSYTWPIGQFQSVAVSPDGLLAAAGNMSGKIVVWDLEV